jgi:hypothetical protein
MVRKAQYDFVTGLPPSDGNTTILTMVDTFSKAAHFILLPMLPSAKERFRAQGAARISDPWTSGQYVQFSVLIPVQEGILHPHWVVGQPVLWFSSQV